MERLKYRTHTIQLGPERQEMYPQQGFNGLSMRKGRIFTWTSSFKVTVSCFDTLR